MQSDICKLLPSTVFPQLVQSAFFLRESGSAFPPIHLLGAIMAWSFCVQYHSLPNTSQTHLKQTADHCHWLLIVVNHGYHEDPLQTRNDFLRCRGTHNLNFIISAEIINYDQHRVA